MKIPNSKLNKNITLLKIMADKKENKYNKINESERCFDTFQPLCSHRSKM